MKTFFQLLIFTFSINYGIIIINFFFLTQIYETQNNVHRFSYYQNLFIMYFIYGIGITLMFSINGELNLILEIFINYVKNYS